ncbi:unnamed protein product [Lepeophtheirus salmonis]|uniref:G patch domain-containing protein 4 n=1 Tax=Lepeophtheirus salmonis TaxID=72036 RepID=A0A7R8H093_LEPSM|nr:unnamed protein product [Lepeophtheirus salmonis]CAF2781529.1 unnamed protein product [Lepeophtheirus salmonis]
MSDFNTDQSFAKRLLKSQGWMEGSGLGKNAQGIVDPVKPSLKFDTTGVGHDQAKEFTDHWWARAYDKAAKEIKVEHNDDGSKEEKKALYSGFIKSATLNDGALTSIPKEEEAEGSNERNSIKVLSDEELFAACDGLTAHMGARHGHSMSAKYKRLAELDKQLMDSIEEKKRRKKK